MNKIISWTEEAFALPKSHVLPASLQKPRLNSHLTLGSDSEDEEAAPSFPNTIKLI